jgi:hypothetical protein
MPDNGIWGDGGRVWESSGEEGTVPAPLPLIPTTVREGVLVFCSINFWLNDSNFMSF